MDAVNERLRGWVEIYNGPPENPEFHVYEWSEYHDAGWCAGVFEGRKDAVEFARALAKARGRKIASAEIIQFEPDGTVQREGE